jgi:hypothetical protein
MILKVCDVIGGDAIGQVEGGNNLPAGRIDGVGTVEKAEQGRGI